MTVVELLAFWVLMVGTLVDPGRRARLAAKPAGDWVLDLAGLAVQGALIPALQLALAYRVLVAWLPGWRGLLDVPPAPAFLLSFVVVDYLFYWNHRLLHGDRLWAVHRVHHSMTDRDVLGTSRNTLWSSFFLCYLWAHGAMLFLLREPWAYLVGVSATAVLDLWRHSSLDPAPGGLLDRALSPWLILPRDHAWHHAEVGVRGNFGANLKLWDRLHGTVYSGAELPATLGIADHLSLPRRLLWPFAP